MPAKSEKVYAGIGSDAVRAKTGKGWDEWFAMLDKAGAAKWPHKEIAIYLHDQKCGDWWSQMVTVGYEQARGLRVKHQTADGFSANASKTIATPVGKLFEAWTDAKVRAKWLTDSAAITVRSATKNKVIRIIWKDGTSIVEVRLVSKGPGKSQVAVERRKLKNAKGVQQVKAYWGKALDQLKAFLEEAKVKTKIGKAKS